jgi:hypothetical protein
MAGKFRVFWCNEGIAKPHVVASPGGWSTTLELFLRWTAGVKSYLFAIKCDISHVRLEDGGDVAGRELIPAKHDQEAGFAAFSVADDYQLSSDFVTFIIAWENK